MNPFFCCFGISNLNDAMQFKTIFLFLLLFCVFELPSCYILTAYKYRHFKLESLSSFRSSALEKGAKPFRFQNGTENKTKLKRILDSVLAPTHTYSFLVIRNDSILYENYFQNIKPETQLPSFSVAKSVVSTLVGIALEEGKIKSLDEPITAYLPELKKRDPRLEKVTIQHLLDMRSGVKSVENGQNPFSNLVKLAFSRNVNRLALKTKSAKAPGEKEYKSLNTQLLGLIVERATQQKLQSYLQAKIWTPLQMESDANWNTDAHQTVRAFCCINATTRDFAKFGRLYLKKGNWNGQQIVSEAWVKSCTDPGLMEEYGGYKNQWWSRPSSRTFRDSSEALQFQQQTPYRSVLNARPSRDGRGKMYRVAYRSSAFYAAGVLNQFVFVHPTKNVVIVRMGRSWGNSSLGPDAFLYWVAEQL